MNHFAKIAAQLESRDLDGMLLTHEANRFYASGFHSAGTDGMPWSPERSSITSPTPGTQRPPGGMCRMRRSRRQATAGAIPPC